MYIYNGLIQAWDVKNKTIIGLKFPQYYLLLRNIHVKNKTIIGLK